MPDLNITFEHKYKKLLQYDGVAVEKAILLQYYMVPVESLTHALKSVNFDDFLTIEQTGESCLLLIFRKFYDDNREEISMFTVVKSYSQKRMNFLEANIGKVFRIKIKSEN